MTAGWNSGNAFSTPPGDWTTYSPSSFLIFLQRDSCSNRQNICFCPGFVLAVEADRAVRPKIVGVSGFGRMAAFDAIHSAASDHIALAFYHKVDFFCCRVVVRPVRSSGSKIHQEKTVHHVGLVNQIPFSGTQADQKLVQNRVRMTADRLFFRILEVCDLRMRQRGSE